MSEKEKPQPKEQKPPAPTRPGDVQYCDLCGSAMLEWHCRIVCPACGYQRDCSDP